MWRHQKTCSVCVKQALNTRRWLVNALVTWHVSYKITTLHTYKTGQGIQQTCYCWKIPTFWWIKLVIKFAVISSFFLINLKFQTFFPKQTLLTPHVQLFQHMYHVKNCLTQHIDDNHADFSLHSSTKSFCIFACYNIHTFWLWSFLGTLQATGV